MSAVNELHRNYPNGYSIRAREGSREQEAGIYIGWWKANGQPAHQELFLYRSDAKAVLHQLAAFAEELERQLLPTTSGT